ncbi:hypothetical protein [Rheinheimera sp.]|uniref:hypothetical protein n=1 Tax=Rheinheimera sp. TaxID=1869214 RepID=UPI003D26AAFA
MKRSVFLSYPQPFNIKQANFIKEISDYLINRGFEPRTLGVTDYDMDAPLKAIRRLMLESNGLITVAFRRTHIKNGTSKPDSANENKLNNVWLTSPYSHIEPAMAFQVGLPVLLIREKGVIADGVLEKGVIGTYLPEFDLDMPTSNYLASKEWEQIIHKWEGYVSQVIEHKGNPPRLY